MTNSIEEKMDELEAGLIPKLVHLISLDEPENGGPYQGIAARACLDAMRETSQVLPSLIELARIGLATRSSQSMADGVDHAAIERAIMIEVQCHDFGTVNENGDFICNNSQIDLLEQVCAKAAARVLALLPSSGQAVTVEGDGGWGDLLIGYQRICAENGIEPTSKDVLAAMARHDAGEPIKPQRPFCYTATLNLGPRPTIASYFKESIYTVPLYTRPTPPVEGKGKQHDPKLIAALQTIRAKLEALPEPLRGPFIVNGLAPYTPPVEETDGVTVTDEMTERACCEYVSKRYGGTVVWPRDFSPQEIAEGRENLRAALRAALPKQGV